MLNYKKIRLSGVFRVLARAGGRHSLPEKQREQARIDFEGKRGKWAFKKAQSLLVARGFSPFQQDLKNKVADFVQKELENLRVQNIYLRSLSAEEWAVEKGNLAHDIYRTYTKQTQAIDTYSIRNSFSGDRGHNPHLIEKWAQELFEAGKITEERFDFVAVSTVRNRTMRALQSAGMEVSGKLTNDLALKIYRRACALHDQKLRLAQNSIQGFHHS